MECTVCRLKDIYFQRWCEKISLSSKCYYYSKFKVDLFNEVYLSCVDIKKFRQSLARFRCSSHDLMIESGRYRNIQRHDRVCPVCNLNEIEDEFHFLLICPLYYSLRCKYIRKYYYVHPTVMKFSNPVSSKHEQTLQNLAIFIHNATLLRNNGLMFDILRYYC